ncbi:hypothetical protein CLAFUW4_05801 [Fulvia fulva]|nr:hypothetical protein CLAFUR4_05795 [Fulvia fulva]WPV14717.1 hypothetical protein CLAFUW4_05801 [Fulvia fulva]WPV30267.1 hypothetical protein CLAFUW7_05799 [Fulvia fulva]
MPIAVAMNPNGPHPSSTEKQLASERLDTVHPADDSSSRSDTRRANARATRTSSMEVSPSERSLRYATMNAVPASPEMIISCAARRTAAIPRSARSSNACSTSPVSTSRVIATDTVRTDELLSSFPAPPVPWDAARPGRLARSTLPQKRPSWSIFPRSAPRTDQDIAPASKQPRSAISCGVSSVVQGRSIASNAGSSSPQWRGESWNRDRHSGVPLNGVATTSLHSFDRRSERQSGESASAQASSLRTRALHGPASDRSENQRAIVNGAHRYNRGRAVPGELAVFAPSVDTAKSLTPDQLTDPTPVIQGPSFCKHRLAKLKARQLHIPSPHVVGLATFDGSNGASEVPSSHSIDAPSTGVHTSTPVPSPTRQPETHIGGAPTTGSATETLTTAASDPMLVSNTGIGPPGEVAATSGAASVTASGRAKLVQRRNEQGTWRTRMSKTTCWRCEMAAVQESWWHKIKYALQYTCLCHYRGYYNEEDREWKHERKRAIWRSRGSRVGIGPHGAEDSAGDARQGTFAPVAGDNVVDGRGR